MNKILVEVSVGELLDKISILEIKKEKIKDSGKLKFINDEHAILKDQLDQNVKSDDNLTKLFQSLKNINAKFLLAGDLDPDNPTSLNDQDLQNIIEEKVVELLGYQKDIPALYARSHIICLPSFYGEGLPKALIEAAAAGRAVVTTDIPGCKDAIISNKTGLLVPAKNPQKLADTLEWLIKHHEERIAMGKAGRKFAEKEFPIEKIVQNHLNIYQELIIQDKPK